MAHSPKSVQYAILYFHFVIETWLTQPLWRSRTVNGRWSWNRSV